MLDRREALRGLMLALGGPAAVAGCNTSASEDDILRALRPDGRLAFYSPRDFRFVELMSDALIPRTDTPGAIDAQVPEFMDAMMAAWASQETRQEHRLAISAVRGRLNEIGGRDLGNLSDTERAAAIAALDAEVYADGANAAPQPESLAARYRALKKMIADVYYSTEIGATQELHYELVPERWAADIPLAEAGRTWAF